MISVLGWRGKSFRDAEPEKISMGAVAGNNRFVPEGPPAGPESVAEVGLRLCPVERHPRARQLPQRRAIRLQKRRPAAVMPMAVDATTRRTATRDSRSAVRHRSVVTVITPLAVALLTVKLTVMLEMPFA